MEQQIALRNWLAAAGLITLVTLISPASGQTPWESAPAIAAPLPSTLATGVADGSATSAARVFNLPPPPAEVTVEASSPGIAMPAFVSLSAQPPLQPESQAVAGPPVSLTEGLSALLPTPNSTLHAHTPQTSLNGTQVLGTQTSIVPSPGMLARPNSFPPLPDLKALAQTVPARQAIGSPGTPPVLTAANKTEAETAMPPPVNRPIEPEEFSAAKLIAVVGTEHVLAGDMAIFVEPIIEENRDRIPSPAHEKQARNQLTRQALRQYVEVKAIYLEFFRDMLGNVSPKELQATKAKFLSRAGMIFYEKQVPVLMKKYDAKDLRELEQKLLEKSLSLVTLRSQFIEQVSASELERKYVPDKFEITREELLEAYRKPENQEKWNVPGRARWRQLTVRFDKHNNRVDVDRLIREMGNEVYLGGKPFEAVAKQSSEGYTAGDGGIYDWTTQGSLKSKPLDEAVFSLPLNRLSQVIVDDIGMHIVEVLEREVGHIKDFTDAQAELRESISNEKRNKEVRKFRDRIMARTTVWTMWPEDIEGSRPLAEALGNILD